MPVSELSAPALGAKRGYAGTRHLGDPAVIWIRDSIEQLLDTIAPDWRDDPELGKERADRIDDGSLLTDEDGGCDEASNSSAARASWSARTAYLAGSPPRRSLPRRRHRSSVA